ncbi:MAG: hypothetical protein LC655_07625, partial [Bacteroidales bacterium]|nr:hypothetical protein [Bacteroidales bacterium]
MISSPRNLVVSVTNTAKTYGTADPAFEVTYDTFAFSEDVSALNGTLTISREPGEDVGTYVVTASGLTSDNYIITFVEGELEIIPAALTVTVANASKVYGENDPDFTATFGGFQWEDDAEDLEGTLVFTREPGEDAGTYAITASGLTSNNYTITFVEGELTITPAQLTVTVANATKVYGENDPDFTATFGGFQWEDDAEDLEGTLVFTREPGENVGTYA